MNEQMQAQITENEIEKMLPLGLLAWYPIEPKMRLLFVGKDAPAFAAYYGERGCLADALDMAENFSPANTQYDIILVTMASKTTEQCVAQLRQWRGCLTVGGHLLIAMENRLGLRYFCGDQDPFTHRVFDGIEGYQRFLQKDMGDFAGRLWSKAEMEQCIREAGFSHNKCYSILPGLEMPQQIYAEGYLPSEEMDKRYTPYYHHPQTVFLSEIMLYPGIIANGMFHQMANGYLLDCTTDGDLGHILSATTALDRGTEFATATVIYDNDTIEKKALFPEGQQNLEHLIDNTARMADHGISVVPLKKNKAGNAVLMPYVHEELALTYLRRIFMEDIDLFLQEMDRFVALIRKSSVEVQPENEELAPYYHHVYIDMLAHNCFHASTGEFVFFDQEFCAENYPVGMVIVRAVDVIYGTDRKMREKLPEEKLWERYGVLDKVNMYLVLENKFVETLRNREGLRLFNKLHMANGSDLGSNYLRMNYSHAEYQRNFEHPLKNTEGKKIFVFGSGLWAKKFLAEFGDCCRITAILDNQAEAAGSKLDGIPVVLPGTLQQYNPASYKVIICVKNCTGILQQLKDMGVTCYSLYDPNMEWDDGSRWHTKQEDALPKEQHAADKTYKVGYVAGVFDLFHVGHLNIIKRAKEHCDYLLVGVVSDEQASKGKAHSPYVGEKERLEIVRACKYVDEAFLLPMVASDTMDVYKKYHFDVQFSGSDYEQDEGWLAKQAWLRERGADLVFFPYTETTSSTKLKEALKNDERK